MDWLTWSNIARELVAWMADASARVVVLAILVLLLVPFIRRSSTAQHTAWTVVFAGMLVLPFLRSAAPPISYSFATGSDASSARAGADSFECQCV